MVKVKEDLTGKRFGKLLVLQQAEDYVEGDKHRAQWLCQCDCGSDPIVVRGYSLKRKKHPTTSCGCRRKEAPSESNQKENRYDISGECGIGFTNNTKKEFYFDLEDYDLIKNYCWCETVAANGYHFLCAWDKTLKQIVKMHWVLGCKGYDHHDRNALNNRRSNLVPCTTQENNRNRSLHKNNTSGFTGVYWSKSANKWIAKITVKEEGDIYLGSYYDKNDAIKARLRAEYNLFKEFAPQRHLFQEYGIIGGR